ncbi:MAG: TraM recognition domain-containing protein [Pseudonocardiaceae bacterium]|nr:TraM recognition domain-containing protein [Pseudonocardiaceae bacterium]
MLELTLLLLVAVTVAVLVTVVSIGHRQYARAAGAAAATVVLVWWLSIVAPLLTLGLLAVVVGVGFVRFTRTSALVSRWGARTRRKAGVASTLDVARIASAPALRRKAGVVRPSLAGLTFGQRMRLATTEVAVPLCRAGLLRCWTSIEDVLCLFGGPRTGKTGFLAGRVIDAPGAAVVTSTRTDLHELTAAIRAEQRGPVYVFNAVGLAGLTSTITFDPLTGCEDPVTATERATDLLAAGSTTGGNDGEREFWTGQAIRVLAALLHAAALGGLHMRSVLEWVANPAGAQREVSALMRRSSEPALADSATQFLTLNDRTQTSITSTIMPSLGWLASPAASAAATGGDGFDVTQLLRDRATVYLLGAAETHAAPLVTALTGHIAREARRLATYEAGGRLDPPLTLVLDEAALISPVPLDQWTADMGGRGVTILAAFQSRAQLIDRWGANGAAIILNNAASIMVFGGTRDRDDLDYWATLAGERDEPVTTYDNNGRPLSRTVRKTPVLAPSQLANLPAGRVVLFRRGLAPVIGPVRMAWRRRDVRAQQRAERRAPAAAGTSARDVHVPRPRAGEPGEIAPSRVWADATREDRP